MPAKLPRTANRLLRSLRRQTKLSSGKPPSLPEGLTATGRQAQFLPLTEKHTFANAPTFRDTVPAVPLLTQLSSAFGRIGNRIKPYSVSLPLLISSTTVPPDGVDEEVPHLDCSYCAIQRHCLHTSLAFRLPLGFPRPMFHSGWGTQVVLHRRRTMASCRWLCIAPQRTLAGCGYTLELSRDPRFPEVPTAPGFPLQPSCITACSSAYVCGTGYALPIRPPGRPYPTFTRNQVTPAFPPMRRFMVAQHHFPAARG